MTLSNSNFQESERRSHSTLSLTKMTDPLVSRGNMFTCKGSQNHMISNMWKDTVDKEQRAARKAASRQTKDSVILPPIQELRAPAYRSVTAGAFGTYTFEDASKHVLEVDRAIGMPNAGHKPILKTTFFRTNGVF